MRLPGPRVVLLIGSAVLLVSCGGPPPQSADGEARAVREQLDRKPQWDEHPPAPEHGSQSRFDPPSFVWLPVEDPPGDYVLEVSRSDGFHRGETTRFDGIAASAYVPQQPIGAGTWHWRAGVAIGDGRMAWSRARRFGIADDARPWPMLAADELATRVPRDRPRLFFPGDALVRVRTEAAYALEDEYQRLLVEARRAVGQELPAEPGFVRAKGPTRDAQFARVFRATRPPMDAMEACALAYLLSGDRRFGLEAKRRLLHFFAWDPEGPTSLFHNPEPAMWVMQRGVRAYDWTHELFEPRERARIEAAMKARCRQFVARLRGLPFESRPYHSHAARDLGFLGEAAICFMHEWPEARDWLHYVVTLFRTTYPAWAEEDGGWNEGPTYWTAYMDFALHFVVALRAATGEDLMHKPFFRNTPYYKLYANPPYAAMSPFGDGQEAPPGPASCEVMSAFSSLLGDPHLRWYCDVLGSGPGRGPLGFSLHDPSLRSRPPAELPQARCFAGAGLVAMHADLARPTNNAYLLLRSSPLGSISHGHADQNAFAIEAFGEALAIASGYYPHFNSAHHRNWTRETKAANAITFDGGQGQVKRSPEAAGRIAAFETGPDYDYALADASAAYGDQLSRCRRHVLHVRPGTFVVIDEVAAPQPVRFEWRLHALEKMEVRAEDRVVLLRRRKARLCTTFVAPRALAFEQTDRFIPPPENRAPNQWHLTASTAGKELATVFFTVLRPFRLGEDPPAVERIVQGPLFGAAWEEDGTRHEVYFSLEGVKIPGLTTASPLAAVRRTEGEAVTWTAQAK